MTEQGYVHRLKAGAPGKPIFFVFHGTGGDERQFFDFGGETGQIRLELSRVVRPEFTQLSSDPFGNVHDRVRVVPDVLVEALDVAVITVVVIVVVMIRLVFCVVVVRVRCVFCVICCLFGVAVVLGPVVRELHGGDDLCIRSRGLDQRVHERVVSAAVFDDERCTRHV